MSYVKIAAESPLPAEEQRRLAILARDGDIVARNRLVTSNMRMLVRFAQRYSRWASAETEDFVNAGVDGILDAIKRYDPAKCNGASFLTYASYWVVNAMHDCMAAAFGISLTTYQHGMRYRAHIRRYLELGLDRDAVIQRVAREHGVSVTAVNAMIQAYEKRSVSMDMHPVGPGGDTLGDTLGDRLASTDPSAEELLVEEGERRRVQRAVRKLYPRLRDVERVILDERILGEEHASLTDIGKRFDLSRERTRQLDARLRRNLAELLRGEAVRRPARKKQKSPSMKARAAAWSKKTGT